MFTILIVVMASWVCAYVKTYPVIHLKHLWFSVCQLYFNKAVFKPAEPGS